MIYALRIEVTPDRAVLYFLLYSDYIVTIKSMFVEQYLICHQIEGNEIQS